jgi:hypothetical protein
MPRLIREGVAYDDDDPPTTIIFNAAATSEAAYDL